MSQVIRLENTSNDAALIAGVLNSMKSSDEKEVLFSAVGENGSLSFKKYIKEGTQVYLYSTYQTDENGLTGEEILYYPNNNKKQITTYNNNLRDGKFVQFNEHGHETLTTSYINNKEHGLRTEYQDSEINEPLFKSKEAEFKNGKENGLFQKFYSNGKVKKKYTIAENGQPSGLHISYFENGLIHIERSYALHIKDNVEQNYYVNDGAYIEHDENGTVIERCTYKNSLLDGIYTQYHHNGCEKFSANFCNGLIQGPVIGTHINGEKAIEATFKNGSLASNLQSYFSTGSLDAIITPEGSITAYHENGKKRFIGTGFHFEKNAIPCGISIYFEKFTDFKNNTTSILPRNTQYIEYESDGSISDISCNKEIQKSVKTSLEKLQLGDKLKAKFWDNRTLTQQADAQLAILTKKFNLPPMGV